MKTGQDIVDASRVILQDELEPYRYSTAQLAEIINIGLYEVRDIRPDAFIGSLGKSPLFTQYTESTLDSEIPIDDMFYPKLIAFMCGYAELRDDEFTVDARAGVLLNSFRLQLRGKL